MTAFQPPKDLSFFSPPNKTDATSKVTEDFIFVDEANHSPGLKELNRRRVRARARSIAARLHIQKNEKGRKSKSTGPRLLVPYEQEHSSSLGQDHSMQLAFRRQRKFSTLDSTENTGTGTAVPLTPSMQEKLAYYRSFYGPIDNSTNRTTNQSRYNSPPSPGSLLGAGKIDPFSTLPVETKDPDTYMLMDFSTKYILPAIYPDDNPHQVNSINTIARAWMSASVANPFLLNIQLWSICIKRDIMRGYRTYDKNAQGLLYKVEAIRQLNRILSRGNDAITDEVIMGITGLATHEVVNFTENGSKPFNSPLQQAGLLHTYGGLQMIPEHRAAVLRLIALRGGIETLKLTGLAECIVIGEVCGVMNSCFTLKPVFPPLRFHEPYIAGVKRWARTTPTSGTANTLGQSFRRLPECGLTDTMLEVLECMEATSRAIDHHFQGKPGGLTLGQIVRTRTGVQKRLLILPKSEELPVASPSYPDFYESCRLTAIIFSVAVIYPIPNTYDVLQTLVRELTASLNFIDIENQAEDYFRFLLWVLVLGGIAALEKPERTWFVSNLAVLIRRQGTQLGWEEVEEILKDFLWLDCACSPGGRQLWDEVTIFNV